MEHPEMPRHLLVGLLFACSLLVVPPVSAQTSADKEEAARVARLIARLGSEDFREREEATRDLDQLGPRALEALRKAAELDDAEIRRRATHLASVIGRRLETTLALEPKRVQLLFRDTPVPDALDDFARRTGYTIVLAEGRDKLAARKITLDTGSVTFWEAFDQFCQKAGVVEPSLLPQARKPATAPADDVRLQQELLLRRRIAYPTPAQMGDTNRLTVVDGKMPVLSTALAGAVRIRALPLDTPLPGQHKEEGDKVIPLEVTPEPGFGWQGVLGMRIIRASDEEGRKVRQPAPYVGTSPEDFEDYAAMGMWGGMPYEPAPLTEANPHVIPACLNVGGLSSKVLKELHGIVTIQIQTPLQPLLTVDDVLKATGKEVQGPHGGTLCVTELKREKNGQINLHVHLEAPPQDGDGDLMPAGRGRRFNRAIIMWRMAQMAPEMPDLRLLDAKGQPWKRVEEVQPPAMGRPFPGPVNNAHDFEPKFQPGVGQAEPARLVYMGRRTLILDVPFTLKDVPLR
jgi:hypothetical protein